MALDQLDQTSFAPTADSVLFHLSLFGEFCETRDAGAATVSAACECLRDAVEETCKLAELSCLSDLDIGRIGDALHQAEATLAEGLPSLYSRTRAARGYAALSEVLETRATTDLCRQRERRVAALGNARRFANTLGVFSASRQS